MYMMAGFSELAGKWVVICFHSYFAFVYSCCCAVAREPVLRTTPWSEWSSRAVRWTWYRSNRSSSVSLAPLSMPWSRSLLLY